MVELKIRQLKNNKGVFLADTGCAMNLIKEDCLQTDIPVNITDRIKIIGIPSYDSAILNVFEKPVKFL